MVRADGRKFDEIRSVRVTRDYISFAEGSVLFELGSTRLICTASVEGKVPPFLVGTGQGWVTAEYSMLPRATETRNARESHIGKLSGRTQEIQRLIGRSLRAVVDLESLPELTIWLDCDVLQADGGTRTAAVTGSFVALYDALKYLLKQKVISQIPLSEYVAATSVGLVEEELLLDLCYSEDAKAQVDMNVVMAGSGEIIEVQATAEKHPFSQDRFVNMIDLAKKGILEIVDLERSILKEDL